MSVFKLIYKILTDTRRRNDKKQNFKNERFTMEKCYPK